MGFYIVGLRVMPSSDLFQTDQRTLNALARAAASSCSSCLTEQFSSYNHSSKINLRSDVPDPRFCCYCSSLSQKLAFSRALSWLVVPTRLSANRCTFYYLLNLIRNLSGFSEFPMNEARLEQMHRFHEKNCWQVFSCKKTKKINLAFLVVCGSRLPCTFDT